MVLNSWRGITLGQNVRPLARIGACRALQGLMWGRAESRGGTEQPISCRRECRWHDSLRRDETRRFICPRLHLSMPRPRCPALSLRSVSLVHEADRPRKSKSRCRTPYGRTTLTFFINTAAVFHRPGQARALQQQAHQSNPLNSAPRPFRWTRWRGGAHAGTISRQSRDKGEYFHLSCWINSHATFCHYFSPSILLPSFFSLVVPEYPRYQQLGDSRPNPTSPRIPTQWQEQSLLRSH